MSIEKLVHAHTWLLVIVCEPEKRLDVVFPQ
jgi:hypothetical protein